MKVFAFVLLSVLATAFAAPSNDNELTASEEQFVNNFFQNYGKEIEEYIGKALHALAGQICTDKNTDFEGPMEEVVRRAEQVDEDSQTVCWIIENHLYNVLEPMVNAVDGCLPNQQAGVADFVVRAIVSVVSHACRSTGEEILEWSHPCLDEVEVQDTCIQDAEGKWDNFIANAGKSFKELACGEYTDARHCFETAIAEKCKLEITKQSVMGLLDSIFQSPCNA